MAYAKHNFQAGHVLRATELNAMEDGIVDAQNKTGATPPAHIPRSNWRAGDKREGRAERHSGIPDH